ncbi:proteinase-activated receptor 2-like [Colossoma macropomum]|uniref:proteinase-activated receptor 2-like n=1 Tax=Colossoma macropomum TaxID=42526 RepID=UPI001864F01D|nr:proteinase-activated receptor 2-like [Colossoma macropomum]
MVPSWNERSEILPPGSQSGLNISGVSLPKGQDIRLLEGNLTTVFLPLIYIIVFIVGLPTNATSLWVFLFRTKKKHPSSILMANLALADLLFIIWLPLKITYHFNRNNWTFGEPLCKVLVGFFYGNMYCSTIFIACISVQRYWAIVHPLSRKLSNHVTVRVCVCVWIVVWLLTVPLYLYKQTIKVSNLNITTCHDVTCPNQTHFPVGYFLTMGIVGYVVPCVVCTVAYLRILCSLRKSMNVSSNKQKRKAITLMIIVLVMFLVCFTPSNITLMVHFSLLARGTGNNTYGLYIIMLCLSSLNSCLDPFVYYFISDEFRDHVKNMLSCHSARSADMKVAFRPVKVSTESSSYTWEAGDRRSRTPCPFNDSNCLLP